MYPAYYACMFNESFKYIENVGFNSVNAVEGVTTAKY